MAARGTADDYVSDNLLAVLDVIGRQQRADILARQLDSSKRPIDGEDQRCHLALLVHQRDLTAFIKKVSLNLRCEKLRNLPDVSRKSAVANRGLGSRHPTSSAEVFCSRGSDGRIPATRSEQAEGPS